MIEAVIVLVFVAVMAAISMLSTEALIVVGIAMTIIGVVESIPTGIVYHVRLRAALVAKGTLPARWWLSPVRLHESLSPAEMAPIWFWFRAGAIGFLVAVLGCVLAIGAAFKASFT